MSAERVVRETLDRGYTLVAFWGDSEGTGEFYESASKRLVRACEDYRVPYLIEHAPEASEGYLAATRFKPTFLKRAMAQVDGPVLYTDVDSILMAGPVFDRAPETPRYALTATGHPAGHLFYLPQVDHVHELIDEWIEKCEGWPGGDHSALAEIFPAYRDRWMPFIRTDWLSFTISQTVSKSEEIRSLLNDGWGERNPLSKRFGGSDGQE